MANKPALSRTQCGQCTITLPITQEQYTQIIDDPQRVRAEWLDPLYADCPELFPDGFEKGYEMNGHYTLIRGPMIYWPTGLVRSRFRP